MKLVAIVEGGDTHADPAQLAAKDFEREATKLFGGNANAVIEATAHLQGPLRLLDVALRTGPYGDQFGARPDGLTLAKVQANAGGVDLGELAPRLPEMLRTPSGKVELAPPQLIDDLKRPLQDLVRATPPMVIVGRREVRSNNSWMHNLPLLAKGPERCTALVHPDDAARLQLTDGAMARISSRGGSIEARVQVSGDMMPGVVSLPHGWGHSLPGVRLALAAERPGANLNALLDEHWRDPLSGNAVLSGVPVELIPATPV
jgi:anaerobic selenocysteine-containing dehydrogenase